jgi:hypothetical protein
MGYIPCTPLTYLLRGRVSKQVTNGSKSAVMDAIHFLCVSPCSSTVQLHDSLGSRRAYACSEAGFSSQNGDRAWGVYYRRTSCRCAFFVGKRTQCKDIHKEMFWVYCENCLSCKAVHNYINKFSQGRSTVADDARPDDRVEIAIETTVLQRVEELIRVDRRITTDSVTTALRCPHGLAYCMIVWSFGKCAHGGCPENWKFEERNWTE